MFVNVCRRSTIVAQSTTEAEYFALAEAARELLWIIRNFLAEIDQPQAIVKRIWQDNTTTINLATSHDVTEQTKHIDGNFISLKVYQRMESSMFSICPLKIW